VSKREEEHSFTNLQKKEKKKRKGQKGGEGEKRTYPDCEGEEKKRKKRGEESGVCYLMRGGERGGGEPLKEEGLTILKKRGGREGEGGNFIIC